MPQDDGSGLIGPNLTDDFQLHGQSRLDIFKTVRSGVPGTAMVAWVDQMPPVDVMAVAVYAGTLRGQNLPGKAREGRPVGRLSP
jgi:cytochrome c oxidase cbb3-type subunit III